MAQWSRWLISQRQRIRRESLEDSKGRARQPSEKKRCEVVHAYAVTTAQQGLPPWSSTHWSTGGNPKCNLYGYHRTKACWSILTVAEKVIFPISVELQQIKEPQQQQYEIECVMSTKRLGIWGSIAQSCGDKEGMLEVEHLWYDLRKPSRIRRELLQLLVCS